jgi:NAD(P)H-nitrite reductase large subunit
MVPTVLLSPSMERKIIVVVGLGMVGLSFIEKILEYDTEKHFDIVTFSEENLGKASSLVDQKL